MESKGVIESKGFMDFLEQLAGGNMVATALSEEKQTTNYVSLFDYLGKPAGSKLGKQVFGFSKTQNIKVMYKTIDNGKYHGNIICYPPEFLDIYFEEKKTYEEYKQYFE